MNGLLIFASAGITTLSIAGKSFNIELLLFLAFGLILLGVTLAHKQAFYFSVVGCLIILILKEWINPDFHLSEHLYGQNSFFQQLLHKDLRQGEWPTLVNIAGLLLGFSILAKLFEDSQVPDNIPKYLPKDWRGPFVLLVFVFIISTFLDNIASALIGGAIAIVIFDNKVHVGYIAAIVAASNAGGAGSVVGDTTTTLMWINGVSPLEVVNAFIASGIALIFLGWFAARQQHRYQPMYIHPDKKHTKVYWMKLIIVLAILVGAILANFLNNMPALGVWIAILLGAIFTPIPWKEIKYNLKGTFFLLGLIFSASLMPVKELPTASWHLTFFLGIISAFFDNIPLTKLCLEQGNFDWGLLAYAVGFGGSMIWFGSSAGVAITNRFESARNVGRWVKSSWYIVIAYVLGFFLLYSLLGWRPVGAAMFNG